MKINPDCKKHGKEMFRLLNGKTKCIDCMAEALREKYSNGEYKTRAEKKENKKGKK